MSCGQVQLMRIKSANDRFHAMDGSIDAVDGGTGTDECAAGKARCSL